MPKGKAMTIATSIATSTATFEPVADYWQAIIDEAIENNIRPVAVPYLAPILNRESSVVWVDVVNGCDNRAACDLILALIAQRNRYNRNGLTISGGDCNWIIAKLKSGEMTVVGNYLL